MRQLVVPAAGLSSRFGSPKLLVQVAGERLIDRTLHFAAGLFDEVLVLVAEDRGLPGQVLVQAGTGSAGALREIAPRLAGDVTVLWSDIVLLGPTLDELAAMPLDAGLAPYVPEVRPYCHLVLSGEVITGVDYGQPLIGNHDQGVFRFRGDVLRAALAATSCQNLLECLNWMYWAGAGMTAYRTSYPTLGFNEPEKLETVRRLVA